MGKQKLLYNPVYARAHNEICRRRDSKRLYFDPLRIDLPHGRGAGASSFCAIETIFAIEKSVEEHLKPRKEKGKPPYHTAVTNDTSRLINALFVCSEPCRVRHAFEYLIWAIQLLGLKDKYEINYAKKIIARKETANMIRIVTREGLRGLIPLDISFFVIDDADTFSREHFRDITEWILGKSNYRNRIIIVSWNPRREDWLLKQGKVLKQTCGVNYRRFPATYKTMKVDWLGESFFRSAENLRLFNSKEYKLEYLGKVPKNVPHGTSRGKTRSVE